MTKSPSGLARPAPAFSANDLLADATIRRVNLPTLRAPGFDGCAALTRVIEQSDYSPCPQAEASLTVFAHPDTCRADGRSQRLSSRTPQSDQGTWDVRTFGTVAGWDARVMRDDNRSPAAASSTASSPVNCVAVVRQNGRIDVGCRLLWIHSFRFAESDILFSH